ncbi:MAG: hypothetical protein O2897_04855 [bacterium]|nr:hypothetical protein [bacterium]
MTNIRIGGNVDSWCTKCKLILAHTVEAAVKETIKRVHCNTCLSKHVFRAYAPGTAPKTATVNAKPKSRSTAASKKASLQKKFGVAGLVKASDYEAMLKGRDAALAKKYSYKQHFGMGEMMEHTVFGLGVVTADKGSNKIEVLFEEGPKVMLHDRQV